MLDDACREFTDAVSRWVDGLLVAKNFRRVAQAGVPIGERTVHDEMMELARTSPHMNQVFQRGSVSEQCEKEADFAASVHGDFGAYISVAINAASLVFMHAMLDGVTYDYLRCSALMNPRDWKPVLVNGQLTAAHFDAASEAEITHKVNRCLQGFCERSGLLAKADALCQICSPSPNLASKVGVPYDRDRLNSLIKARNEIAHGHGLHTPIANFDGELRFLEWCGDYLMEAVKTRYGLSVDFDYLMTKRATGPKGDVDIVYWP